MHEKTNNGVFEIMLKKLSKDFIFSVAALIFYNGILQLVINPYLEGKIGADSFGIAQYFVAIASIMGTSVGSGCSYARMIARKDRQTSNGDYNRFLLTACICSFFVSIIFLLFIRDEIGFANKSAFFGVAFLLWILISFTIFRYYSDIEYRMTIRFDKYFIFYASIAIGNVAGILLFSFTQNFILVFILGEVFGIIFTYFAGSIYKKPFFAKSKDYSQNFKGCFFLTSSNLLASPMMYADRIVTGIFVGARQVTIFYSAALIGKIAAMITTPVNGIIIAYLTKYKFKFTKKIFLKLSVFLLFASFVCGLLCAFVSDIFVKYMYADIYLEAKEYFVIANMGQVLFFVSSTLMVIVMNFTKENLQLFINEIYFVVFLCVVLPAAHFFGLYGIAYGIFFVNLFRLLFVFWQGYKNL